MERWTGAWHIRRALTAAGLLSLLLQAACGGSSSADQANSGGSMGANSAGAPGSGGAAGSAGQPGTAGTPGLAGAPGVGGAGGVPVAVGTGSKPTAGTGSAGAAGGSADGGTSDGGSATPTFTQLYQTIFAVSCAGTQCHNPGAHGGLSVASQSAAYASMSNRVTPGKVSESSLYTIVQSGRMPPTNPKLTSAQLAEIAAWIMAGAPND